MFGSCLKRDSRLPTPLGRRIVTIEKEPFLIGRQAGSDLHLPSAEVSRDHAEIVSEAGGLHPPRSRVPDTERSSTTSRSRSNSRWSTAIGSGSDGAVGPRSCSWVKMMIDRRNGAWARSATSSRWRPSSKDCGR